MSQSHQPGQMPSAPQHHEQYGAAQPKPSRALEITGFVLSFFGILAIAGLIISIITFRRNKRDGRPRGLSLAGIIISIVVLLLTIASIVVTVAGVGAVLEACGELGPGTHVVDGVTYTCG